MRASFDKKFPGMFHELYSEGWVHDFRTLSGDVKIERTIKGKQALDYHEQYEV